MYDKDPKIILHNLQLTFILTSADSFPRPLRNSGVFGVSPNWRIVLFLSGVEGLKLTALVVKAENLGAGWLSEAVGDLWRETCVVKLKIGLWCQMLELEKYQDIRIT